MQLSIEVLRPGEATGVAIWSVTMGLLSSGIVHYPADGHSYREKRKIFHREVLGRKGPGAMDTENEKALGALFCPDSPLVL